MSKQKLPEVGAIVEITQGTYKGTKGEVVNHNGDYVVVVFTDWTADPPGEGNKEYEIRMEEGYIEVIEESKSKSFLEIV